MQNENGLALRLQELRKINGYTQYDVSTALGVVRQTYSHYETGRRMPKYDILFKLSELYHISLDDLMALAKEKDPDEDVLSEADTAKETGLAAYLDYFQQPANEKRFRNFSILEKELLYYFEHLPDVEKRELIEIAKIKFQKQ